LKVNAQVRKSVVNSVGYHLLSERNLLPARRRQAQRREEVATMINDTFEVSVAGAVLTAWTSHASHAAATAAAALKHRAAAATDASVDWGLT
jgi:hypothetical protein